jgi:NAD(P)-dependent dehydrogenase (short-subunit alcohol dehydrogenase family)
MDVTSRKSVEDGVASIEGQLGGIDILINNAGAARTSPFLDMTEADWGTVIETCLTGVWRVGQVVARSMVARRCGSIINIASVAGLAVQSTQANYSAAKAGVLHLTRVMAYELARHNVRVNAIAPGYFGTEMNADFVGSVAGRKYIERLVPGRLGELDELDGPVLLLASTAGKFITGTVLPIDGGTLLKGL